MVPGCGECVAPRAAASSAVVSSQPPGCGGAVCADAQTSLPPARVARWAAALQFLTKTAVLQQIAEPRGGVGSRLCSTWLHGDFCSCAAKLAGERVVYGT